MKRTASGVSGMASQAPSKHSRTSHEPASSAENGFPRWSKGTVWVHLSDDPRYQYQLHKAVLERTSTWFSEELRKKIDDSATVVVDAPRQGVKYLFVLERDADGGGLVLVRKPLQPKGRPNLSIALEGAGLPSIATTRTPDSNHRPPPTAHVIDLATSPDAPDPAAIKAEQPQEPETLLGPLERTARHTKPEDDEGSSEERFHRTLTAYNNLFLIYYNHAPTLSTTAISLALIDCESLIAIAERHGSLPVIGPYLGNTLSQYHHALFAAIATDPPRWLNVSIALHSASIFSESVTHLAGCWPAWPWPTAQSAVAHDTLALVAAKALTLTLLRAKVDANILRNTIAQNGAPVTLKDAYETWLVVQLFRDWFLDQLSLARKSGMPHCGGMYRVMRKGGDAYLPVEEQVEVLEGADEERGGCGVWEEVGVDLRLLKDFARGEVEVLCRNRLMLDVEEGGVEYLTCVEVKGEDFPWLREGGVGGDEEG